MSRLIVAMLVFQAFTLVSGSPMANGCGDHSDQLGCDGDSSCAWTDDGLNASCGDASTSSADGTSSGDPTCSSTQHTCGAGKHLKPNANNIKGDEDGHMDDATCCNDLTCEMHTCSAGMKPKGSAASITGYEDSVCCDDKKCNSHNCGTGNQRKSNAASITGYEDSTCCDAKTCDSHSCSTGMQKKSNAASITGHDDTNCCDKKCSLHTCGTGKQLKSNAGSALGTDDATCCEIKKCDTHTCGTGKQRKPNPASITGHQDSACCEDKPDQCVSLEASPPPPPGSSLAFHDCTGCSVSTCSTYSTGVEWCTPDSNGCLGIDNNKYVTQYWKLGSASTNGKAVSNVFANGAHGDPTGKAEVTTMAKLVDSTWWITGSPYAQCHPKDASSKAVTGTYCAKYDVVMSGIDKTDHASTLWTWVFVWKYSVCKPTNTSFANCVNKKVAKWVGSCHHGLVETCGPKYPIVGDRVGPWDTPNFPAGTSEKRGWGGVGLSDTDILAKITDMKTHVTWVTESTEDAVKLLMQDACQTA